MNPERIKDGIEGAQYNMPELSLSEVDPATVEAGPGLDALLHETFYGIECSWMEEARTWYYTKKGNRRHYVPAYSTDIGAAMRLVDGLMFFRLDFRRETPSLWQAMIAMRGDPCVGYAPTAPLAICRAALAYVKAHGVPGVGA